MAVLLALHGYTQNGSRLREQAAALLSPLGPELDVVYPDAPHACREDSVAAAWNGWRQAIPPPPHYTWWRATDDGRRYDGVEQTQALLKDLMERHRPVGILGFSQGAMVAAVAAALSEKGALPALEFVVLIAGGAPRADALVQLFDPPLRMPSLHVWGKLDIYAENAASLLRCFDPETRSALVWPGRHAIPNEAGAAQHIREFMARRADPGGSLTPA